ncbi:pilin [Acinetobacter larvae]|uniref:Prepilin-type N-terminal cleavage/methylation domain-containing protein n=1 Tax=Acinetobacter larvae TaxID=1789224 RepID=A0A1B2LVY1_9GAMM|nr:pilin [Acinetobacter larvae]AOA57079.1 hypothetical protein BFG52_01080 [Acinetobacter larvae]
MKNHQIGFSLLELVIVLLIIGILAVVAVPAYQNYVARAQLVEAFNLASSLKASVVEAFIQDGQCLDNTQAQVEQTGVAAAQDITGRYVESISLAAGTGGDASCTITAKMKSQGVASDIQAKSLVLTMSNSTAVNNWRCSSSDIAPQFLPKACQVDANAAGG